MLSKEAPNLPDGEETGNSCSFKADRYKYTLRRQQTAPTRESRGFARNKLLGGGSARVDGHSAIKIERFKSSASHHGSLLRKVSPAKGQGLTTN